MPDVIENDDSIYLDELKSYWSSAPEHIKDEFLDYINEVPESKRELKKQAKMVLKKLNEQSGRNFREKDTNLNFIIARLQDGIEIEELYAIIIVKCREWKGTNMEYCLRPATLFNKTKCEQYLGQLG